MSSLRRHAWGVLAGAYLAAVTLDVVLGRTVGLIHGHDLGSSPAVVAAGRVSSLLSSAFLVEGRLPGVQLAALALAMALMARRHGARTLCGAGLTAHLGSAIVVYALLGLLLVAGVAGVRSVLHDPDYGVSCVLAGAIGALLAGALLRLRRGTNARRRERLLAAGCAAVCAGFVPFSLSWYGVEHLVALGFGAGYMLLRARAAGRLPFRLPSGAPCIR